MVRWPRSAQSFRAATMCRNAGWYFGAKKNAKWCRRSERAAPPASDRSARRGFQHVGAAGLRGDGRLPCLATATPAADTIRATVVEMLKVLRRSPPVPQTSRMSRARSRRRAAVEGTSSGVRGRTPRSRPWFHPSVPGPSGSRLCFRQRPPHRRVGRQPRRPAGARERRREQVVGSTNRAPAQDNGS